MSLINQRLGSVINQGQKKVMNLGYARVSTEDQNPDLQLAALKQAGCTSLFTDKATGAHVKRPELTKCLKALAEGDTLTVWKLDRLVVCHANF